MTLMTLGASGAQAITPEEEANRCATIGVVESTCREESVQIDDPPKVSHEVRQQHKNHRVGNDNRAIFQNHTAR